MKKILLFVAIVIILVLGVWGFQKSQKDTGDEQKQENKEQTDSPSTTSEIKTTPNSDVTIYIGKGCPHCEKVEEFIKANKIDEKAQFDIKEVWYNEDNNKELTAKAEICKIPQNDLGVPLLFDSKSSKCFVGEDEITTFLKQLAGIN